MRSRLLSLVLGAAVAAISLPPGVADAAKKKPPPKKKGLTAAEIHAAVAKAEHSPDLWATVNVCTSSSTVPPGDVVGIRGQMPSLGFPTKMSMSISVAYWNTTDSKFEPTSASQDVSLGTASHGVHQGGVDFPFTPPPAGNPYLVRGTVTFEWMMGSKVIGKVTRNTGHGYPNVNYSNPPGFSAGTCTLT